MHCQSRRLGLHRARALSTSAVLLLGAVSLSGSAQAQGMQGPPGENAYCAHYDDGSESDCGFPTLPACRTAVSGTGGYCEVNVRLPGQYLPQQRFQLIPSDPFGAYRSSPSQMLPPVPPPPGE